jgi:hypothetical protein
VKRLSPRRCVLATPSVRVVPVMLPSLSVEGAGKTGWPLHPRPPRKRNLRERDDHRYRRRHSGLPCAVVLRLIRTLPGEPAFATVASPIIGPRSLAPAWARQDHTTSPYAKAQLVSQRAHVHRIPASRVVTTAIRPSASEAGCANHTTDSTFRKTEIFLRARLDSYVQRAPDGQINLEVVVAWLLAMAAMPDLMEIRLLFMVVNLRCNRVPEN